MIGRGCTLTLTSADISDTREGNVVVVQVNRFVLHGL